MLELSEHQCPEILLSLPHTENLLPEAVSQSGFTQRKDAVFAGLSAADLSAHLGILMPSKWVGKEWGSVHSWLQVSLTHGASKQAGDTFKFEVY